jgi:hypothetical protein
VNSGYEILISKLDEFIRKYYRNRLIKGLILFLGSVAALFLLLSVAEYIGYFSTVVRAIFFYFFIVFNLVVISRFIVIPLLQMYKIGRIISNEQAAQIIGKHFTDVKDSLLNTLQLKKMADEQPSENELLMAGIQQKIDKLSPVPFTGAVDIRKNRKYLPLMLPPVLALAVVLLAAPSLIFEPAKRIGSYNIYFEKPAPFNFIIQNKSLEAMQQEDFLLEVKTEGEYVPEAAYINIDGNKFRMNRENTIVFKHQFRNLQKTHRFYFEADGYRSKLYSLQVLPRPVVLSFELALDYPDYTGKKDEILENSGDVSVPAGTQASWLIKTRDTRNVIFSFEDSHFTLDASGRDLFRYSRRLMNNELYSIKTLNKYVKSRDSLSFSVNIIPDAFPTIKAEEYRDSVFETHLYFRGIIRDDYGFSKLLFKYSKTTAVAGDTSSGLRTLTVPVSKASAQQEFFHYFDLSMLAVEPGDEVEYYFEIWDNDAVNGSKSSRTEKMTFRVPTRDEIKQQTEKRNEEVKDELSSAIDEIDKLQQQIDELNRKLLEKKELSWQERKQVEDLLKKQQDLTAKIEKLQQQYKQNNIREQQFNKADEELLRKQQELEKLFNEIMSDEMKDMFKKLQEMLDKMDKNNMKDMLDKMKLNNEDLKKQMDRNLELFKQLEYEKKISESIEELKKLAEEQKQLSEKTPDKNNAAEELLNKQNEISEKFDSLRAELDKLEKLNNELEDPNNLKNTDQQQQSISDKLQQSKEQLNKNQRKNASGTQKDAADEMEKLADELEQMQAENEMQNQEEDINSLRDILENLIKSSFAQEDLIMRIYKVPVMDPQYVALMEKQRKIADDMKMIEDSLLALAKRQAAVKPFISRETALINEYLKKTLSSMHDRNSSLAANYGQHVMTSSNNLALMLAESLKQMMEQMQQMQSKNCKSGNCNKPGKKPGQSAKSMRQLQEQMNKKMQELKEEMGGKKPGKQGKSGQQSISEQLARLAAEQEALRKMLQEYGEQLKSEGVGDQGQIAEMLKLMEQTETDLVNKMITEQTLLRQREILTRLLESEKAEQQREMDEKRESEQPKSYEIRNPQGYFEYKRDKSKGMELLKTIPPALNSFFRGKANEYFYNFEE